MQSLLTFLSQLHLPPLPHSSPPTNTENKIVCVKYSSIVEVFRKLERTLN